MDWLEFLKYESLARTECHYKMYPFLYPRKKNPVVFCSKDVIFNQVLLLAQMVFNNLLDSNRLYKLGINLAH